jgi:hypothetical protein
MHEMLRTAFSGDAVLRKFIFERFSCFRFGETVEDSECSGCPSTCHTGENVESTQDHKQKIVECHF